MVCSVTLLAFVPLRGMFSVIVQPPETGCGESTGSLTNVPGGSVIPQGGIRGGGMEMAVGRWLLVVECTSWLQFSVSTN